jgi:hypothetical protein
MFSCGGCPWDHVFPFSRQRAQPAGARRKLGSCKPLALRSRSSKPRVLAGRSFDEIGRVLIVLPTHTHGRCRHEEVHIGSGDLGTDFAEGGDVVENPEAPSECRDYQVVVMYLRSVNGERVAGTSPFPETVPYGFAISFSNSGYDDTATMVRSGG